MKDVLSRNRDLLPPCRPPFWAPTGHLQTVLGHLIPSGKLATAGGLCEIPLNKPQEKIIAHYYPGEKDIAVYVFHGLGGSADSGYMHRTAQIAQELGYHVFVVNHRGCGEGKRFAQEIYHSGRAEDLSAVFSFGKSLLPSCVHIGIGFSLSANALCLLSAGQRGEVLPDAAIAVNGPINLLRASLQLTQGFNAFYDLNFLMDLKAYMKMNRSQDSQRLSGLRTLRDFDDAVTAPLGGFKNKEHYYEECSAKKYLPAVKIPLILLTAADDPFVSVIDYLEAKLSNSTYLHLEKVGGHMGYLSMEEGKLVRWLDLTLKNYLLTFERQFA